jgi:serine/threonine-protein kinase
VSESGALPSPKPSRGSTLLWIGAALLGVLGITAAFASSGRQRSDAPSGATAVPSSKSPLKSGAAVLGPLPEPASTPSSSAAGALPPESPASAESSLTVAPKRAASPAAARSVRSPASTPAPARKSAAAVHAASGSCNPPYVLDARGIRRVKPECM